jgi:CrcB protein
LQWRDAIVIELLHMSLWVALGSAVGGMARFFFSGFVGRRIGETFPWGTMVVNVTGAFAIGLIAAAADARLLFDAPDVWALIVTGFLGSYTTVSSFSLQTLALARDGDWLRAGGNVLFSLGLCLCAVALGFAIGASASGGRAS